MPNGRSIVLERQPGADTAGYAGLEDGVDNHWGTLFKAALLSTLLGVGSELGSGPDTGDNGRHHPGASSRLKRRLEPDRPESRSTQSSHSANVDNPAGFSGAGHRQP
jgi:type IV secretory pathway VirB10-like protein